MVTPKEARELDDVQMRLDHMDQLGWMYRSCTTPSGWRR